LAPLLSTTLAFTCAHNFVEKQYNQLLVDIGNEEFENLDMLHHFTSGMKSVFSDYAQASLYSIRQSIGGAGYSAWSGIPYIIEEFAPTTTFEGDNTVMA
jgi:acyl-CoA oxidase